MKRRDRHWAIMIGQPLLTVALMALSPASVLAQVTVGATIDVNVQSPPPSQLGGEGQPLVWRWTLHHAGATFLKVHISELTVGPGDAVRILDSRGDVVSEYSDGTSHPMSLWALAVRDDTLTVELRAGLTNSGARVVIDQYGYGTVPIHPMSICGSNEAEDVACYAGTPIETTSRAVGRVLVQHGDFFIACTGFLISALDHLLTNEHCVSTQRAVDSLEVTFGLQSTTCGGSALAPFETFAGDRLILANHRLDVALLTLAGHPSQRYGFLALSERGPAAGEALYLPQHPAGQPKKVSVTGCQVSAPKLDGIANDSDFGHLCDTESASSGSPILDLGHQVVGLHRFGGCTTAGGQNQAVLMSRILPVIPAQHTAFVLALGRLEDNGVLTVKGDLRLGFDSSGIAPREESVSLVLADADGPFYSASVPPGLFRQAGASFVFDDQSGRIANGLRVLRLRPLDNASIRVSAKVRHASLEGAEHRPITVMVQVGDDIGGATVSWKRRPRAFIFP